MLTLLPGEEEGEVPGDLPLEDQPGDSLAILSISLMMVGEEDQLSLKL